MSTHQVARRYVRDQRAVMRRYGSEPKLTREQYWQLVRDCRKPLNVLERIRRQTGR